MTTGKAALFTKAGEPMYIKELPLPELEPGSILVKVTLANICGSDLHMWRGTFPAGGGKGPWILGHEMIGRVHQLGPGVSADSTGQPLAVGDRVVYCYFMPCGHCYVCMRGNLAACRNKFGPKFALASEPPYFTGAYAEYYYVKPGQYVFKVPDAIPDEVAAPINCALSQVTYGLEQVGMRFGDTVVVQGAGGLGINTIAVARDMGASNVIVIDGIDERLKLARDFGADHTIDLREYKTPRDRIARVRALTGGQGADIVCELVGAPQVVPEGIEMLSAGGGYLWIGNINRGRTVEIDPSSVLVNSRRIVGVITYHPGVIPRALQFLNRNLKKYPFERLLSHKFKLEQINEAFVQADQGKVTRASIVL